MAGGRRKPVSLPSDSSSSPERPRRPPAKKQKTLSDLFQIAGAGSTSSKPGTSKISSQTQAKKASSQKAKKRAVVEISGSETEDDEDIIEISEGSVNGADVGREGAPTIASSHRQTVGTVSGSPKGNPRSKALMRARSLDSEEGPADDSLWCDKHKPLHPSDLAVHHKKTQQVRSWLREAFHAPLAVRKYRKLLVLSGPAGSGKTAVIRALATTHAAGPPVKGSASAKGKAKAAPKPEEERGVGYEVLEWSTAEGRELSDGAAIFKFRTWLARATAGPTLVFAANALDAEESQPLPTSPSTLPTLLLVEDLPNVSHPDTREVFLASVGIYLSSSTAATPPLVLVISDSTARPGDDGFSNALSMTVDAGSSERTHSVFSILPRSVLQHPKVSQIRFNPTSATLLKKLLSRVADAEWAAVKKGGRLGDRPTARDVDDVIAAAAGDLRSALNGLQFFALHGRAATDSGKRSKKKSAGKTTSKNVEEPLGPPIAGREASLVIFHSLGKILYNKRWGQDPEEDRKDKRYRPLAPSKLPKHLKRFDRPQLKTDVDSLFSDTTVSTDIFTAYLHHNFPSFCVDVKETESALEYLSQADALMTFETSRWSAKPLTSLYSFHVVCRGMLMSLPSPVPRKSQKLYKPETWAVKDQHEEMVIAVDEFRASAWTSRAAPAGGDGVEEGQLEAIRLPRALVATELMPFLALIGRHNPSHRHPSVELLSAFAIPQGLTSVHPTEALDEDEDGAPSGSDTEDEAALDPAERRVGVMDGERSEGLPGTANVAKDAEEQEELWFEGDDDIDEID